MHSILSLGFTLLEVLISLLLFSMALLGLDIMEFFALHSNMHTYYTSVAEQQIQNMEERLRMLGQQEEITQQVHIWNQENHLILPQGEGVVTGSYPEYTVTLCWGGKHQVDDENSVGDKSGCITEQIVL